MTNINRGSSSSDGRSQCRNVRLPKVQRLRVEEVGDTFALIRWREQTAAVKFYYELIYGELNDLHKWTLVFPHSKSATVLRNLKTNSSYTVSLHTYNECTRTNHSTVYFATLSSAVNPAITKVLPQEIFLTCLVLGIWLFILRHFFLIYSRVTLVTPLTYGDYLRTKKASMKRPSMESLCGSDELISRRSKSSHVDSISNKKHLSLLEDAVQMWRSETVLSKFELVDGVEPIYQHSNADRLSIKSDLGARRKRTATNNTTTASTTTTTTIATTIPRKKTDVTAPICITMDNDNDNNNHVLRIRDRSAETKSLEGNGSSNAPSETPFYEQMHRATETHAAKDNVEPMASTSQQSDICRKLSEVLLGKATRDIRRNSSTPNMIIPTYRKRLQRRLSRKFASLRKSTRLRKGHMGVLEEEIQGRPNIVMRQMSLPVNTGQRLRKTGGPSSISHEALATFVQMKK